MKRIRILAAAAAIVVVVAAISVYNSRHLIMSAMGVEDTMTEAQYIEALDGLSSQLLTIQQKTDEIDTEDVDGAKAFIEDMKKPFQDFALIDDPPASFAEGHEEICLGCDGMVEYLDMVKDIVGETDEEKLAQAGLQMTTKLTEAMKRLRDGAAMIEEAK